MELLAVLVILVIVGGGVCGIVAITSLSRMKERIEFLERELSKFREKALRQAFMKEPSPSEPEIQMGESAQQREPAVSPPMEPPRVAPIPAPILEAPSASVPREWTSLEVTIGSKWFNWVGVILVIVGVMFFLKYAYDNNWIGPAGRIAIASIAGAGALIAAEKFRRASYPLLFQSLTGGGLAVFYGCIYFSFQVYGLTGQAVSFMLSVLVTALAVLMSMVHDAPVICLLGQLGGFLSPVLISTGENRPVALFSFVAILNLATIGCAWFRNWRFVNAAGFIGTWVLYAAWADKYYDLSQIGIALFFSALFYLTFLTAPMLQAFSRGQPLLAEDLWLVSAVIFVEFVNNYLLLFEGYRPWLGLAVVFQALTLSALYAQWTRRSVEDSRTRATLLLFALALVTVAIPIQFRFYAIPIAWAVEAVMLGYVGQRYKSWPFHLSSLVALILATLDLLSRLPLHSVLFTPVFNRPFGSWATVIASTFATYVILKRNEGRLHDSLKDTVPMVGALGLVLACALAHMEVAAFWSVRADQFPEKVAASHQFTSLALLWAAIPLLLLWLGRHGLLRQSALAACAGHFIAAILLIVNAADQAWIDPETPFFNLQWMSRFCIVLSFWIGVHWMQSIPDKPENDEGWTTIRNALEAAGHVFLVVLLMVEVNSWISSSTLFSPFMRFGFVSALWSLQALTLIGFGLITRSQFRRIMGFVLFGATVTKLLMVDVAILQPVYRILSFAATGALLIAAAYLYQRFARALLDSSGVS